MKSKVHFEQSVARNRNDPPTKEKSRSMAVEEGQSGSILLQFFLHYYATSPLLKMHPICLDQGVIK